MNECEKNCDYWWRYMRWDGEWSQWFHVELIQYASLRKLERSGDDSLQTRITKKGETP